MTTTTDFNCETCYDTGCIDYAGAEIDCPDCSPTLRLTGLRSSLVAHAAEMFHCTKTTATTAEFRGTHRGILDEAIRHERAARLDARQHGLSGRNYRSSAAIALTNRIRSARTSG